MTEAQQTPLLDLLRAVPADARAEYEHGQFDHSMIPYGRLCAEAAQAIAERDAEIARLRNALKLLGEGSTPWMDANDKPLGVWEAMAKYAREALEGK